MGVPSVCSITPICREDEFVILACDGIWDCKTNQVTAALRAAPHVLCSLRSSRGQRGDSALLGCLCAQEAVDFVKEFVARSTKPREEALRDACEALCDDCLSEDPLRSEGGLAVAGVRGVRTNKDEAKTPSGLRRS